MSELPLRMRVVKINARAGGRERGRPAGRGGVSRDRRFSPEHPGVPAARTVRSGVARWLTTALRSVILLLTSLDSVHPPTISLRYVIPARVRGVGDFKTVKSTSGIR